ncbi:MAG: CDP-alcohol phosphatidyltransferase family protein [Trueperaceae bacterium]
MPTPAPKARPRRERAMLLLQPVADRLVAWLAPTGCNPLWIVALHGLAGVSAAGLVAWGATAPDGPGRAWAVAAALLLVRALLDNVDGGLARATGRVTRTGRYLDTLTDLIVNLALFAALATVVPWGMAAVAFALNTVTLSLDANMERLYRVPRTVPDRGRSEPVDDGPRWLLRATRGLYDAVLAPQDRWIERADRALFRRLEGRPYARAPLDRRLAWSDLFSTASLVDLGLSTQSLIAAGLLLAGWPQAVPVLVLLGFAWAVTAQGLRIVRYRAYRRSDDGPDGLAGGRAHPDTGPRGPSR